MSIVVCSLFLVVFVWALASNPDLFSPAKFYLFSFLVFHLGALSHEYPYELWLLILLVLLVGATTVLFEAVSPLPSRLRYPLELRKHSDPEHFLIWIWGLSLPALMAEAFLVWKLGGLAAYVNTIGNRVIEFRGYGAAITLSGWLVTFNLAYFAVGLTRARSAWWWSVYGVHFLTALAVGLLSGSRSGFLTIFVLQLFCYHYIRGKVSMKHAVPIAMVLVFAALLLGMVRNAVKVDEGTVSVGGLTSNNRTNTLEYGTFQYGVQPLQILLDADYVKPVYGMTLVSVVTNVVPREWWPEKPDTGGVFFTKQYTHNAWGGASNLTPTLLGESIINFGWTAGIALYVLVYPLLMYLVVVYYRRVIVWARAAGGFVGAIEVAIYVCVMWAAVGLMVAEVTTTVQSLLTTRIVPLLLLKAVLGTRTRPMRHPNGGHPSRPLSGRRLPGA